MNIKLTFAGVLIRIGYEPNLWIGSDLSVDNLAGFIVKIYPNNISQILNRFKLNSRAPGSQRQTSDLSPRGKDEILFRVFTVPAVPGQHPRGAGALHRRGVGFGAGQGEAELLARAVAEPRARAVGLGGVLHYC